MVQVAASDVAALDELVRRFWGPLTAYASRMLGDRDAGKDVAQTAIIRLWQRRVEWRAGSVRAYLIRLTRNLCLDDARRNDVRTRLSHAVRDALSPASPTPADTLDEEELRLAVDQAIQALPPRRREVFILAYLQGLSYNEIAETLGISPSTVSNQLVAAVKELRERCRSMVTLDSQNPGGCSAAQDRAPVVHPRSSAKAPRHPPPAAME
jgi:RNA polymerase sigma-70 factor (ECF subfamily)